MSLAGIGVSILLLVLCIYKHMNLILATLLGIVALSVTSHIGFTALFIILYFRYESFKAGRLGAPFEVTKNIAVRISNFQKESHIQPWLSVRPLLLILLLMDVFSVDLAYAVFTLPSSW